MSRIQVSTLSLTDWKSRLKDPEKQWKPGRSAFEMAVAWELAESSECGLPPEVESLFKTEAQLSNPRLLLCVAEHEVALPHGITASQNDVWALVQTDSGVVSLAVEGKAGEDFDDPMEDWLRNRKPNSNREARLRFLIDMLGVSGNVGAIRYQLLHRAASAIIEARRFGARFAAMVVQSFHNRPLQSRQEQQWADFVAFCELLGASVARGRCARAATPTAVPLFLGWADCEPASVAKIAEVGTPSQRPAYRLAGQWLAAKPGDPDYPGDSYSPASYRTHSDDENDGR
jgi:hypothetical protein